MESETFKRRKQFLGDFYNKERVEFLNAIKRDILIKKDFIRSDRYLHYTIKTSLKLTFLNLNIFKMLCKFIKPFTYFLYSFTYYKNFLENKFLYFVKFDIKYGKQILNIDELVDKEVFFTIQYTDPQPYEEEPDHNFLKSIKINDFLNETVEDVSYLKIKITMKYLDVEEEDYLRIGGGIVDMRTDLFYQHEPQIINSSQSFKSEECVICLTNSPNALFCNCGHLCMCSECEKLKISNKCPICKIENTIIRVLN